MITKLKNLIKRVITTTVPTSNTGISVAKVSYLGRIVDSQIIHDYGYYSCAPTGSIGVCFSARAEEQDRVSMVYHPRYYGQELKEGEVVVGNFVVSATALFDAEGNLKIKVPKDVIVECVNSSVTCTGNSTTTCVNSTLSASGSASITCESATINASSSFDVSAGASASITAPQIALNGAVVGSGGMAVTGGMTSEGIEVSKEDHRHDAGDLKDSGGGQCTGKTSADAGP